MATHSQSIPTRSRVGARVSALAGVVAAPYWLVIASIYGAYGFLWYFSAKEKLIDQSGHMPAGLVKAFHGSFLASFPGVDAAWIILGVLEAVACVLFVVSLATGELLPQRRKPILVAALAFSVATFAAMTFAENTIGDFESVASLFAYMTGTVVVLAAAVALTPERVKAWAAGLTGAR
jgi:hypothetical protein